MTRTRRRILVGATCAAILLAVISLLAAKWSEYRHIHTNPNHVTITNINDYSQDLDASTIGAIEQNVYKRIKDSTASPEAYYTATVRKATYKKTYATYEQDSPPSYIPNVTFLVDVPQAERTYRVAFSGGKTYPYSILYVLCPKGTENAYAAFKCSDEQ